jgi:hypothetical protein
MSSINFFSNDDDILAANSKIKDVTKKDFDKESSTYIHEGQIILDLDVKRRGELKKKQKKSTKTVIVTIPTLNEAQISRINKQLTLDLERMLKVAKARTQVQKDLVLDL